MTNEEKAIQISEKFKEEHIEAFIHTAVLEMAEWFKEYLEKKRGTLYPDPDDECRCDADVLIDEIINELFPKEETDCSDNDE